MQQEARKTAYRDSQEVRDQKTCEPRKVEGLLRDFCGDCKKEIFSIVNALKEGAGNDLIRFEQKQDCKNRHWKS
jgi:hypothetical protein